MLEDGQNETNLASVENLFKERHWPPYCSDRIFIVLVTLFYHLGTKFSHLKIGKLITMMHHRR